MGVESRKICRELKIDIRWLQGHFPDLGGITPLASGGQKIVVSAIHSTHGDVVLKLIKPHSGVDEVVGREILAVSKFDSSCRIPVILENGKINTNLGECFWILEERIDGKTLSEELLGGRKYTEIECLKLTWQILGSLKSAETNNIVHRDVKPANIIEDQNGDFWLIDFGIARHLSLVSQTPSLALFGKFTPGYAPPEQTRNRKREIDARADLFALAVTVYEAWDGENPFRKGAKSDLDIINRVETQGLPPIIFSVSSAKEFESLISAMAQKKRQHRPRTAGEAFDWLDEIWQREQP